MMTSRSRVRAAFRRESVDRVPWVPFVGCHGGALINVPASDYLKSSEYMVRGIREAVRRYRPDGLPVAFDLQIEAEILGCDLIWSDENPPAVTSHPLSEGRKLEQLSVPNKTDGRLPMVLETATKVRKIYPDLALYGLITGPFTLAIHLYGTDLFMKMMEVPDEVHLVLRFCRDVAEKMATYYIEAGCDIIAVVDPMTSQISPDSFRQFVTEPVRHVFDHIRDLDTLSSFFVCGHAQQNIEAMCECGPDNISIDENISLDFVRDVCGRFNISFGGNLQLTVVLLLGKPGDAQGNAIDCMHMAGPKGFILAPGCDLPYATPPENIEAVTKIVSDFYQQDVIRQLETTPVSMALLDMSDYGQSNKVIVDIITLDSEACAPCQYMVEAVQKITPQFEGIVEWREHKIKHPDSIQFMTSLMVRNIPTICIDGAITFVSQIPPKEVLAAAIQKRINEKLKFKIRIKKGEIYLLGNDSSECEKLQPAAEQAIRELGADIPIQCISDRKEILNFGVAQTPAVVVATYKIKSEGHIPDVAIVKEWIKEI
jgi:MtaA/CmuA family methyltransferase